MSRKYGFMIIPGNIEVQAAAALDARTIFSSFDDVIAEDAFISPDGYSYCYVGMQVVVTGEEDFGVYILNTLPATAAENWCLLSRSDSSTGIDYQTQVTNRPTINETEIVGNLGIADLGFSFLTAVVVDELPELEDAKENTIYLTPPTGELDVETNTFVEWILQIAEDESRSYECLGNTTYDFTNYYTKEEVDALVTFVNEDETTTSNFESIGIGDTANGIQMQELVERLFFNVIEPVIVEPSYSATLANLPEALMFTETYAETPEVVYDLGSITLDGVRISDRANGENTFPSDVNITAPEEGETVEVDLSATFGASSEDVLKSDGSVSDTYSPYAGETFAVVHEIPLIGEIFLNGELLGASAVNVDEMYVEVKMSAGDVLTFNSEFYQYGISGVQMLNGFSDTFNYIASDQATSLNHITSSVGEDSSTFDITTDLENVILRFEIRETVSDFYTTEVVDTYTLVGLTEFGVLALNTGCALPDLPTIEGDISVSGMFKDAGVTATSINIDWSAENIVDVSYMFEDCTSLEEVYITLNWDNVTTAEGMFKNCTALTVVEIGGTT